MVIVIGWDGATWDILNKYLSKGFMPNLERLIQSGSKGHLMSTIPPVSAPAWTTFATGKNPGKHGILDFYYKGKLNNSRMIKEPTLWRIISHLGGKVGIINVPLTYPPTEVNGFMITGILTPSTAEDYTYPNDLLKEFPEYKIDVKLKGEFLFRVLDYDADINFIKDIEEVSMIRGEVGLKLFEKFNPDLAVIVFTGVDRIFHNFWFFADSEKESIGSEIINYFKLLDSLLGRFRDRFPDANIILMSDHGFGHLPPKLFYVKKFLENSGFIKIPQKEKFYALFKEIIKRTPLHKLYTAVRKNESIRKSVIDYTLNDGDIQFIDLYFNYGGFIVNNQSLIKPIYYKLHQLPFIRKVWLREEIYVGNEVYRFPHIIFKLYEDYHAVGWPPWGKLIGNRNSPSYTGTHRDNGILVLNGPNFKNIGGEFVANIQDICPTILYTLNLPLLDDFDGNILRDFLKITRKPTFVKKEEIVSGPKEFLELEEDKELTDRLKALGYI